uniref:Uncharacterized protein n=1 Tax=Laticauda laticaudata TaxID=8630 RepID=A0A8C5SHK0_LATLA
GQPLAATGRVLGSPSPAAGPRSDESLALIAQSRAFLSFHLILLYVDKVLDKIIPQCVPDALIFLKSHKSIFQLQRDHACFCLLECEFSLYPIQTCCDHLHLARTSRRRKAFNVCPSVIHAIHEFLDEGLVMIAE